MDKYELSLKKNHLRQSLDKGNTEDALAVCQSIDWRRVKDVAALQMAAETYEAVQDYPHALLVLERYYSYARSGKRIAYHIAELALRNGDLETAENYYEEFRMHDRSSQEVLLLEYQLAAYKKRPLQERIEILEEYKEREFEERWGYELAELYHRAGRSEDCVRLCDEIILWFGFGPYVDKALKLKVEHAPLSDSQRELVENPVEYEVHISRMTQKFAQMKAQDEMEKLEAQPEEEQSEDTAAAELVEEELLPESEEEVPEEVVGLFDRIDREAMEPVETVLVGQIGRIQELQSGYDSKVREYQIRTAPAERPDEYRLEDEGETTAEEPEKLPVSHFLVTSDIPGAGLHFAQRVLKQMALPSKMTVRTTAAQLNESGLITSIQKLLGKILIVEQAGELSDPLVGELHMILSRPDIQITAVLIDTEEQLGGLFTRSNHFEDCFGKLYQVTDYSVAELEEYALYCAMQQGYNISEDGLAEIEGDLETLSLRRDGKEKAAIESMVEAAIAKNGEKSVKKFLRSLLTVTRDEEERVYLTAGDFAGKPVL